MYVDHNKVGEQAEITHVILQLTSNKLVRDKALSRPALL